MSKSKQLTVFAKAGPKSAARDLQWRLKETNADEQLQAVAAWACEHFNMTKEQEREFLTALNLTWPWHTR